MKAKPITVVASFKIKAGAQERFEAAIRRHLPMNVEDPGLERFWMYRDTQDPTRYLFYEDWADQASFDASLKASWRASYMEATQHLWDVERNVGVWERVDIRWDKPA